MPETGEPLEVATYRVADFPDAQTAIGRFLTDIGHADAPIGAACFAVAGPIQGRAAQLTNAAWVLDADALAARFDIGSVALVNDFAAAGAGIDALAPEQLAVLQTGVPIANAPRLVIGAGTGLGVAYAIHDGSRYRVVPGEGGHVGFAPADLQQMALWRFLHQRLGRVRNEDVVSGQGLANIYAFLVHERWSDELPQDVQIDGGAAVTSRALEGREPEALEALDLFVRAFGAVVGDHALGVLPRGGVFLAGGIAPRLAEHLRSGGFLDAFNAKGTHAALMQRMPVSIVMEDRLGLIGAARLAASVT